MQWTDDGFVLGSRKYGENSVVLDVLTRYHGRHLGLVRSGRSRNMRPVLQAGNSVQLTWRARLDTHLGYFAIEPVTLRAAHIMQSSCALYTLQVLMSHLRQLPEREVNQTLFDAALIMLDQLDDVVIASTLLVRLEIALLQNLGFGLDFSCCAATGANDGLSYVSPKTGRAVSSSAGEPWKDKLLPLPAFLLPSRAGHAPQHEDEIIDALALTGYFLNRHIYEPREIEMPDSRQKIVEFLSTTSFDRKI